MRTWILMAIVGATASCGWSWPEPSATDPFPATEPEEMPEPPERDPREICESEDPLAACAVRREWGPTVILDRLTLEGTEDDPVCCLDMTGDGELDNSVGVNVAAFNTDPPTFQTQQQRITNGNDAIALEIVTGGVQWWPAAWASDRFERGMEVLVERYAVTGPQTSRFGFTDVDEEDRRIVSTGGTLELPIVLYGAPLRVEATVVEATLSYEEVSDGFDLVGEMGVLATVDAVYDSVNRSAEACECIEGPLLVETECTTSDSSACEPACAQLVDACALIAAAALFADVDTDGDGLNESISAGYTFSGIPASIAGVAR